MNPKVQTGYDSLLFAQFRDDVVMAEVKRLGSVVSNVADSSNPLMNERRGRCARPSGARRAR